MSKSTISTFELFEMFPGALFGLAFGVGYAIVNLNRRVMPLSISEVLFGGVFGLADNADTAADAIAKETASGEQPSTDEDQEMSIAEIRRRMAEIEAYRSSLPPQERERIEREEMQAQRESWIRAMAPCEHGDPDWETCPQCRSAKQVGEAQ